MSAAVRACGSGFRPRIRLMLAAALLPLLLGGCGSLGCGDEVVQREPRPDARGAAVVFVRDCTMTGPSTRVALLRNLDAPPRAGELLFVANADRADAGVRIRWMNVDHLEIAHDPRTRPTRRTPVQRDLRITYARRRRQRRARGPARKVVRECVPA